MLQRQVQNEAPSEDVCGLVKAAHALCHIPVVRHTVSWASSHSLSNAFNPFLMKATFSPFW